MTKDNLVSNTSPIYLADRLRQLTGVNNRRVKEILWQRRDLQAPFCLGESEIKYGEIRPFTVGEALIKTGRTQMVILKEENGVKLSAKLECNNFMGTGKTRGALAFFERAKNQGLKKSGKEIVLSSGGGFALAVAALAKEINIPVRAFLLNNAMTLVKNELLKLDVEIVDTSTTRDERNLSAREYTKQTGAVYFDQHEGLPGFEANYIGTGPEIIKQTDGQVTDIVGGMGTGNSLYGIGKFARDYALYFKRRPPRVTAVESDSSLYGYFLKLQRLAKEERFQYLQKLERQGVLEIVYNKRKKITEIVPVLKEGGNIPGTGVSGLSTFSKNILPSGLIQQSIQVIPSVARQRAIELAVQGVSAGISSGAVYEAGLRIFNDALACEERRNIVCIFMDDGRMYQDVLQNQQL